MSKKFLHNTTFSVQLLYIAGHSLLINIFRGFLRRVGKIYFKGKTEAFCQYGVQSSISIFLKGGGGGINVWTYLTIFHLDTAWVSRRPPRNSSRAWFLYVITRMGRVDGFSSRSSISSILVPMKVFPAPGGPWMILTRFFRTCCSA